MAKSDKKNPLFKSFSTKKPYRLCQTRFIIEEGVYRREKIAVPAS